MGAPARLALSKSVKSDQSAMRPTAPRTASPLLESKESRGNVPIAAIFMITEWLLTSYATKNHVWLLDLRFELYLRPGGRDSTNTERLLFHSIYEPSNHCRSVACNRIGS
jgi:hypothetical protein